MPDGTPIDTLIDGVDGIVRPPVHYLLSCTHPATAALALSHLRDDGRDVTDRLIGIKANGSAAPAAARDRR